MNDELSEMIKESRRQVDITSKALREGLDKHASGEISVQELGRLLEESRIARAWEMTVVSRYVYVRHPELTKTEENDD